MLRGKPKRALATKNTEVKGDKYETIRIANVQRG